MKDFIGQELEIGDYVALMQPNYRNMVLGKVEKFNPKMIKVSYTGYNKYESTYSCYSQDVVKLNREDVIAMKLRSEP